MQWTETILTIMDEGCIRIIPAKFDQNQASLEDVLQKQLLMAHERHHTITKAHLQPMAHMSLKVILPISLKKCLCRFFLY